MVVGQDAVEYDASVRPERLPAASAASIATEYVLLHVRFENVVVGSLTEPTRTPET